VDLRLRALGELDPLRTELPHGTEVTTRVDKLLGERRVPQGTVGRVMRSDGEALEVAVVGIGTLRYHRSEVRPRRIGQAMFARRRQEAWQALRACVVLRGTVGSHAWGLADADSDVDERGVFALPLPWLDGLVAPPEDLVSADGSVSYWATGKAIRQALRADPNTLEMLFLPTATACDEIGEWLLEARSSFVSAEIYGSFGRYAVAQLRRLEQHARLAEHRGLVLEWLRHQPTLTLDDVAARLVERAVVLQGTPADQLHQARQWVKQLYRSLADQGLLDGNEFAALVRFATTRAHEFELPRELRPKNAYNLLRLIWTATQWLRTGEPELAVSGAFRARLLAIKRGEVALAEVLQEAESMMPALEEARGATRLPARPEAAPADALLRRIAVEVARRFVARVPGPFGAQCPPPPDVTWVEDE
jgi:hypothetical protein